MSSADGDVHGCSSQSDIIKTPKRLVLNNSKCKSELFTPKTFNNNNINTLRDHYFNKSSKQTDNPQSKTVMNVDENKCFFTPDAHMGKDTLIENVEVYDILRNVDITHNKCLQRKHGCKVFLPIDYESSNATDIPGVKEIESNSASLWTMSAAEHDDDFNNSYEVITDIATNGFSSPLSSISNLSPQSTQLLDQRRYSPIDIEIDKAIHKTVTQVMCLQNSTESIIGVTENQKMNEVSIPLRNVSRGESGLSDTEEEKLLSSQNIDSFCDNLKSTEWTPKSTPDTDIPDELINILETIEKSSSLLREELDKANVRELILQQESSLNYDYTQCLLMKLAQESAAVRDENTELNAELEVLKAAVHERAKCHQSTLEKLQSKQSELISQLEGNSPICTTDAYTVTDLPGCCHSVMPPVRHLDKAMNTEHLYSNADNHITECSKIQQDVISKLNERHQAKVLALEATSKIFKKKLEDVEKKQVTSRRSITTETQTIHCDNLLEKHKLRLNHTHISVAIQCELTNVQCNATCKKCVPDNISSDAKSTTMSTQTMAMTSVKHTTQTGMNIQCIPKATQTNPLIPNTTIRRFVVPHSQPVYNNISVTKNVAFTIHRDTQTYTRTWEKTTQTKCLDNKKVKDKTVSTYSCYNDISVQTSNELIASPRIISLPGVGRRDSNIGNESRTCDSGLSSESGVFETECAVQTEPMALLNPNITQHELSKLILTRQQEQMRILEVKHLKEELCKSTNHINTLVAKHDRTNKEIDSIRDNLVQLQMALRLSEKQKTQIANDSRIERDVLLHENTECKKIITELQTAEQLSVIPLQVSMVVHIIVSLTTE